MPETELLFFCALDGSAPVLDWLSELAARDSRAFNKCRAALERLAMLGHELRRPTADLLRDGVHELRIRCGRVNYRLLYFFHGRQVAVLAHALTKERAVPVADIDRAVDRKMRFEADPEAHTYRE